MKCIKVGLNKLKLGFFILLFYSCGKQNLSPDYYVKWVENENNGLSLSKDFNGEYKYENYLNRIITDATTYASDPLFPTDDDTIERLNERADLLYNDIKLRS